MNSLMKMNFLFKVVLIVGFCVDETKNIHYPIISDASGMIWSDERPGSSHDDDEW